MAFDPLETSRQALTDFGVPVQVTPLAGAPGYEITALLGSVTQAAGLGQARGQLATHRFRVLPTDAVNLAEGDILTPTGAGNYAVHEVVPVPGALTRVLAVER